MIAKKVRLEIVERDFESQSRYYAFFFWLILLELNEPTYLASYGLNSSTIFVYKGGFVVE